MTVLDGGVMVQQGGETAAGDLTTGPRLITNSPPQPSQPNTHTAPRQLTPANPPLASLPFSSSSAPPPTF